MTCLDKNAVLKHLNLLLKDKGRHLKELPKEWLKREDCHRAGRLCSNMLGVHGGRKMRPPSEVLMMLE